MTHSLFFHEFTRRRRLGAVSLSMAASLCAACPAPDPTDASVGRDAASVALDAASPPDSPAQSDSSVLEDAFAAAPDAGTFADVSLPEDAGGPAAERDVVIDGVLYACVLSPPISRPRLPAGVVIWMEGRTSYDCIAASTARVNCRCQGLGADVYTVHCAGLSCTGCCGLHNLDDAPPVD